jgi:hypothetical protein
MSLHTLLGLASGKAVAAVAGVTLTAGGMAGITVAADASGDEVPPAVADQGLDRGGQVDLQTEQERGAESEVESETVGSHGDGPAAQANARAHAIHAFRSSTNLEGCAFGLGIAAIASGGNAPSAAEVCDGGAGASGAGNSTDRRSDGEARSQGGTPGAAGQGRGEGAARRSEVANGRQGAAAGRRPAVAEDTEDDEPGGDRGAGAREGARP